VSRVASRPLPCGPQEANLQGPLNPFVGSERLS
jgi:hypothetical protein